MIAQALVKQNKHRYTNITLRGVVRRTTSTFMKLLVLRLYHHLLVLQRNTSNHPPSMQQILSLADATGASGGGFSAAIVMAQ